MDTKTPATASSTNGRSPRATRQYTSYVPPATNETVCREVAGCVYGYLSLGVGGLGRRRRRAPDALGVGAGVRLPCDRRGVRRTPRPRAGDAAAVRSKVRGRPSGRKGKRGSVPRRSPEGGAWELARAGSAVGPVAMWGAGYRVSTGGVGGCVAFDHEQFSSEGDLVTYVQWLVNDVYLKLPNAERERFPALRPSNRTVRLRLQLAGYEPAVVEETEGAAIAFRVPGTPGGPAAAPLRARRGDRASRHRPDDRGPARLAERPEALARVRRRLGRRTGDARRPCDDDPGRVRLPVTPARGRAGRASGCGTCRPFARPA